uniref:NAD(P)-binding domain-containing protein n=1 Tax=Phytophthora ramorum TaxID=164328 RepID=H3GPT2_PHYRM
MVKYVLTGVGGNIGGHAADFAVEIKKPEDVLVLTSSDVSKISPERVANWKAKGAIVENADYLDVDSLKKVFEGAEAVAFISTWLFGDGRRGQMKNCIKAAKETGVKRPVLAS